MWIYEKRLQYPVDVKKRDLRMAKAIYEQLGGLMVSFRPLWNISNNAIPCQQVNQLRF